MLNIRLKGNGGDNGFLVVGAFTEDWVKLSFIMIAGGEMKKVLTIEFLNLLLEIFESVSISHCSHSLQLPFSLLCQCLICQQHINVI